MATDFEPIGIAEHFGKTFSAHESEDVDLHLLGFFDDPNRSLLLGEISTRKLPGKSFAVTGQRFQDAVDIFGRVSTSSVRRT